MSDEWRVLCSVDTQLLILIVFLFLFLFLNFQKEKHQQNENEVWPKAVLCTSHFALALWASPPTPLHRRGEHGRSG